MISAEQARKLSELNIGSQNSYPYDGILRSSLYAQNTKIYVPTDMLTEEMRKSLVDNGYKLTETEIGETEISWE